MHKLVGYTVASALSAAIGALIAVRVKLMNDGEQSHVAGPLRATELCIVDADGRSRATIGFEEGGVVFRMTDSVGANQIDMRVLPTGAELAVRGASGVAGKAQIATTPGGASLNIWNAEHTMNCVVLQSRPTGGEAALFQPTLEGPGAEAGAYHAYWSLPIR